MTPPASLDDTLRPYLDLQRIVTGVLGAWPEHRGFLSKRFATADVTHLGHADELAGLVLRLRGPRLARSCDHYRWMCQRLLEEELYFGRHGRYRLRTAAQAALEVYDDRAFMERYMDGLLLSQPLWSNHTAVSLLYACRFLPSCPPGYRHLEVGPGHGLLLHFVASDQRCSAVVGWDISSASLTATRHALDLLGLSSRVSLDTRSVLEVDAPAGSFESIAISEVLEHLEQPLVALRNLRRVLTTGGRMFISVPVNSPAPDHIYLLNTPEEVVALVEEAGLSVHERHVFPASGLTEEQARRRRLTMSVAIIASHP